MRWRECGHCAEPLLHGRSTLLLKGPEEVTDWVPRVSDVGRRMAWRLWPGPVTLVFPGNGSNGLYDRLPDQVKPLVSPDGDCRPSQPIAADRARRTAAAAGASGHHDGERLRAIGPLRPLSACGRFRASTW